jgi:hypothetical protein
MPFHVCPPHNGVRGNTGNRAEVDRILRPDNGAPLCSVGRTKVGTSPERYLCLRYTRSQICEKGKAVSLKPASLFLVGSLLCLGGPAVSAQPAPTPEVGSPQLELASPTKAPEEEARKRNSNTSPPDTSQANIDLAELGRMSTFEFKLSLIVLVFGFLVLLAEFLLLRSMAHTAEQLLRIFGITLIVIGAMMMVPAGFNAEAIAPAMGLLGTIAGYLLGQRTKDGPPEP